MIESMQPKQTFWVGVAAGIMGLCTIGFFILLSQQSGFSLKKYQGNDAPKVVDTNVGNPTDADSGQIVMAPVSGDDHIRGPQNAPVTIVTYTDLECPFCKQFHFTMEQVKKEYGDEVAWVYRHFPLAQLHAKAQNEAHATECAAEQGGNDAFWNYTDQIFTRTNSNDSLPESELAVIAGDIGLNVSEFNNCMASGRFNSKIDAMYQDAISAGGRGTPYSVIIADGNQIPLNGAQPFSQIKTVLDSILQ